jgi:porin
MKSIAIVRTACSGAALLALSLGATAALADEKDGLPKDSVATSLNGGPDASARAALAAKGVTYGINYIGEAFGSSGGAKDGSIYEGRLEILVDADLEKLWGLKGLTFHANGYQIHGSRLGEYLGGPIMAISSIEAQPSTRLFELWLEQKFGERVSVRAGQLAVDSEFFTTDTGANFVNSTFGWAGIWAADLPNGGNAYPLATPGARAKVTLTDNLTFLAAIYNGNPAGCDDGQRCNRSGTDFRTQDDPFLVQELQYSYNKRPEGGAKDGGKGGLKDYGAPGGVTGLPGTIKLGAWQHTDDRYFPAVNESGKLFDSNYGFYASIDQQIFALPSDPTKGVNVFARVAGAPSDRNTVDFYVDGGIVFSGFIPKRPDDSFGVGFAYAQVSDDARDADRAAKLLDSTYRIRDFESIVEVFYKAQIVPGLSIQPDLQYMWNPGGGIRENDNAIYGGVRISIAY